MLQNFVQLLYFHSYEQINKEPYLNKKMKFNKSFKDKKYLQGINTFYISN